MTLASATDDGGTLRLYLSAGQAGSDDYFWEATNFYRVNFDSPHPQTVMAAASWTSEYDFFHGKLDEVRLWNIALTADQVRSNRYDVWPDTAGHLIANFPCDEGQGPVVHNLAGDKDGTVIRRRRVELGPGHPRR